MIDIAKCHGPDQKPVDEAEYGRISADSQPQRQQADGGERWIRPQQPRCESHIS
jgi:hypothetical protein